jgi:DNA invertase Pin-like site-specific DNA recombinase
MARKSRKEHNNIPADGFKTWRTAVYARLSRENHENESETIETQIEEIKQYLEKRKIFVLADVYADNGYSGTNFDRPQFQRLMEDIRERKIDCIVVKDLSRFAREHIDAEDFLNNIFPFLGIRFIAINDNYDNINIEPQEYFMAQFRNFANAHFAKETSRKVVQAKRILQEQGKYIGSRPPYGYAKNPANKHKLIIVDAEAEIVREIFRRAADGEALQSVCDDLNLRGVLQRSGVEWNTVRLYSFLRNEAYIGTLIQRTTERAYYKDMELRQVPKEEQIRIENAIPAIIEREIFEKVQKIIDNRKSKKHEGIPENPYKDKVFCGKCGRKVTVGYKRSISAFVYQCNVCRSGVYSSQKNLENRLGGRKNRVKKILITSKDEIEFSFKRGRGTNDDNCDLRTKIKQQTE